MFIAVAVMRVYVFQIPKDSFGTISLGMIAGDYARDLFFAGASGGVFMIQEERVVVSAGDHTPAVMFGDDVDDAILKFERDAMILTVILYPASFFSVFLSDGRAAIAQPVSVCLRLFEIFKTAAVFFWDTFKNFTMRKMNDLSM